MPAGELYSREIRSSETPEDLHRRVLVQLSPLLAPAKYKLAAQDPQNVEYCRRYLPAAGVLGSTLVVVLAGVMLAAGARLVLVLAAVSIGLAVLLTSRRRESLTVAIQPQPGGSTAFLSGYLTGRARMSLVGFEPPSRSRLSLPVGHRRLVSGMPERPSAG